MSDLADGVLPLIRTRDDLYRWNVANAHGAQMHQAVDRLEEAVGTEDPGIVFDVANRAIASAMRVIARADDSSGIIGDACHRLLELHPKAAAAAHAPAKKLVDWMMKFQFHGVVDYFDLDPVAYAPALGEDGMAQYREALADFASTLGPKPARSDTWSSAHAHQWYVLEWNDKRLAVLDRDVDQIIATHLGDAKVAVWFEDVAKALAEIGEYDLAIEWAKKATGFGPGHQSERAGRYWCELLADHHPDQAPAALLEVFERWPTSSNAASLYKAVRGRWPDYEDQVMGALAQRPRQAVVFAQHSLRDVRLAWRLAHQLCLDSPKDWSLLVKEYQKIDPLATLPIHRELVEGSLNVADAKQYRQTARRLSTMRKLATGTDQATQVDAFIAELRETYRRRPRLLQEFDRASLP
ncbi:MAG: hypothetical protein FWG16_05060 [Micrococcales bacterium]|nr:hypothetical protein [Micrococcales bacterium]